VSTQGASYAADPIVLRVPVVGSRCVLELLEVLRGQQGEQRRGELQLAQLRLALEAALEMTLDGVRVVVLQRVEHVGPELDAHRTGHGPSTPLSRSASRSARSA
jgi:hypothetical protein